VLNFAEGQVTFKFDRPEGVPMAGSFVGLSKSFDEFDRLWKSIILS